MEKVRIGVLSHAHGHAGTYCHIMQDFADVDLIACWDDNEERGRQAAQQFGMEYRADAGQVIDDPGIDVVIVTMETNRHADFVERAAAAGKHILCQKPMATSLEDCDRIIAAVERYGVKFSMAFQMRHDPVNQKIAELLADGAIGKVAMMRRRHAIPVLLSPDFVEGPTRWHFDPVANIGMFFDDASHPADWLYSLFGKPRSVIAEIDSIVTDASPDDNGIAIYRFQRGEMVALLNSSTTLAAVNSTEIYGDEGTIVHDYGDSPSTSAPRPAHAVPLRLIRKGETEWTEFDIPIPHSQGDRIGAIPRPFIDYVRGLTDKTISAEDGRVSVEMVLAAYHSAREGRRIQLPLDPD